MKSLVLFFLIIFSFCHCDKQRETATITANELKSLLSKEKIQLLDVRTPKEVQQGFIKGAVFADFNSDDFLTKATKVLDKKKTVYLYCRTGNRSRKASNLLGQHNFKTVNVLGGYSQYKLEN